MLVSHDRALLRSVCDEFWLVSKGGVGPFDGDLDDYQRYLLDEAKRVRESLKTADKAAEPPKPVPPPVEAKRAAPSGKLKSLRQSLERLDKSLAALHAEKAVLEAKLAGTLSLEEITAAGNQLQQVNEELAREEERWLELSGEIEALEGAGA
jgi:ATP-binding cassette subfamily F protein 3